MTRSKKTKPDVITTYEEYLRTFYPSSPDDHELRGGRPYPITEELAAAALSLTLVPGLG